MVVDLRRYANNSWINQIALVSWNTYEKGGFRILSLVRKSKKVGEDQTNFVGGEILLERLEGNKLEV